MPKAYGTPGPRAIYPDICTSRSLAACSTRAQLLFDRLLSQADDQGRLEGDSTVVKAICVPLVAEFTPRTVETALNELVDHDEIVRYRVGVHDLIQLVTWWRWQAGMRRAYPSRWPSPAGWSDYVFGLGDEGPKTYRDAVGLDKGARKLPADRPQVAGNLPAEPDEVARNLPAPPRAGLGAPAQPLPVPSAGAGAGADSHAEENRLSRTAGSERPDVQALLDRGWPKVTRAQRKVLDEVLGRHDVTGPEFAATVIRSTPDDRDPLAEVLAADRRWQDSQRKAADAEEAEWAATKAADRAAAGDAMTRLEVPDWLATPAEVKA